MNRKEKMALIPKLRFPEFEKNGAINFENGNVIFESISNKNHNSDLPVLAITQEHGAIPRDRINYNVSVTNKSLKSYKVVEIGDFVISLRSFQGGIEYSLYHGICSPAYIILRKKIPIVEQYYKHYFKTNKFIQDLNKDLEGIRDGKMVSYSQFSSILLPKPENKEQQKIADFLSSLDDLITAEDKKLEALKVNKKGLMQKLLPAEGKTMPEWRFPEFRGCREWDIYLIKDFAKVTTGKKDTQNKVDNGKYPFFVRSQAVEKIDSYTFDCEAILTSGDGVGVGKNFHYINGKFDFHQRVYCIYDFSKSAFGKFVFQYFSEHFNNRVMKLSAKNSVDSVRKSMITEMPITMPNIAEQHKISDCLSSIDDLITAQAEKVKTLKLHKKGLMQGLFPSIEEVSG
ncbi:restriction endonuclease subunit S [Bacillus cereus group sp. N11]|uniref:restriction endonuclease subunit S n=1 Tax=Bacillus cereus group sp. N11 TaxID=2794585 RepID=UPI001F5B01A4|nr:restriction endonuclease subunit S [Bacillus cereus group sp. N11]